MTSEDVGTTVRLSAAMTLLIAAALALPPEAAAQSLVAGEVEGTVESLEGRALGRVEVSLTDAGTGLEWTKLTSGDGSFSFEFVPAGEYHIRVEALGYRPGVVTGVPVGPSERVRLTLTVVPEPPPVTGVDTLRWGRDDLLVTAPATGRRVRAGELAHLPDRIRDLTGLAALSGLADPWLGLEGMPGRETQLVAEGEPFRPALHPGASRRTLAGMPFPRMGLGAVRVMRGLDDIEWSGASGGHLGLETRAGTGDQPVEVWGLWSGGGLWSSELRDDAPTSTSIWGGGRAAFPIVPDTSMVSIAVEGARVQTPLLPTRGDSILPSILSPGAPDLDELGVEETTSLSGLARMDWNLAGGKHISARASFSSFQSVSDRPGAPAPGSGALLPVEGTEASVAGVMSAPILNDMLLEVRGSFGYSSRDYQPDEAFEDLPGAWIVGSRAAVGVDPSFPALVERTDFGLSPVLHWRSGTSRLKGGLRLDHSTHEVRHVAGSPGAYFYGSLAALQGGEGAFSRTLGAVPSSGFSVTRAGAFVQYRWTAAPDLDLTTGVRYEAELLPRGDVRQATDWALLTGIANDAFPDRLDKLDARLHLKWDLTGDGRTWLEGGLAIQNGEVDPAALGEAMTLDGPLQVQRQFGNVGTWPDLPPGDAGVVGTRLAILDPDLQAPRTTRAAVSLTRALGGGITMGVAGSIRRTEFLLRRRDLNTLLQPVGTDQHGRPVFGDLAIQGGILAADPESNRRLSGFESVWALDADGWSDYRGVTFSLASELGQGGSVVAEYTVSKTEDDWFGGADGRGEAGVSPGLPLEDWEEGTSDFDVPHRLAVGAVVPLPLPAGGTLAGTYRYRSDLPFTPRVAAGVDANGDGSFFNDVAFVRQGTDVDALAAEWGCLEEAIGTFPDRNTCRGSGIHRVDLRLEVGLGMLGDLPARLVLDGLNLTDAESGVRDDALLLADPGGVVTHDPNGDVSVPYIVNQNFGALLWRTEPGRMFRVGVRIGGGR